MTASRSSPRSTIRWSASSSGVSGPTVATAGSARSPAARERRSRPSATAATSVPVVTQPTRRSPSATRTFSTCGFARSSAASRTGASEASTRGSATSASRTFTCACLPSSSATLRRSLHDEREAVERPDAHALTPVRSLLAARSPQLTLQAHLTEWCAPSHHLADRSDERLRPHLDLAPAGEPDPEQGLGDLDDRDDDHERNRPSGREYEDGQENRADEEHRRDSPSRAG